jgi:pimeloyl-ACP methyl ester carboxylesterase
VGGSGTDATPIALVHGFASSFDHTWRKNDWLEILGDAGRTIIPVDLLGHGEAPRPTDPAEYGNVDELVNRALPAGPLDALGFSAGAGILVRLAVDHPGRFRRLALLGLGDNLFAAAEPSPLIGALEGRTGPEDVGGELFRRLAQSAGNDPEALLAFLRRSSRPLTEPELAAVECPVLVVLGDRDFIGGADRLMAALPNAVFVGLPGVDHFATPSNFGAIDAVMRFLDAD